MKPPPRPRLGQRPRMERYWRSELSAGGKIAWSATVPAAMLYQAATTIRAGFWCLPGLREKVDGIRIISVGNLTVGGNAKTPFTLYLARKLTAHGLRTAIVSRGYGGALGSGPAILVSDGRTVRLSVEEAGDEAIMMARDFDGPIAIARRRVDAIRLLKQTGELDVVLLDDAFQHLRLARDVNLLLVSAERGFGNGWVLPAGPMRERLGAIARADAAVMLSPQSGLEPNLTHDQTSRLSRLPVMRGLIQPRCLVYVEGERWREAPAQSLGGRRILAVSALADARSFYAMLRELEADLVGVLEYPDHYQYTASDCHNIRRAAATVDLVVTTEKDLVKLERFPFSRDFLAALRLEISMGADEQRLLTMAMGTDRIVAPATANANGGD